MCAPVCQECGGPSRWNAFHQDEDFCSAECRHADINGLYQELLATQEKGGPPHYSEGR